ncbi:protein ENHANCED DISEASE RESISTANCE 4 [Heracleum sosnowskyi]|uniref:Protein ENHANCED DISEASE RESISTANCE 4 n=1 Tax=Heracleum sosnowskyi TaxID=360622 RepID=A0AAD8I393_9APIA|nr:protein ENHANCED DISEASE RESISTANCE 4 [Heracleum sosnowskyi]
MDALKVKLVRCPSCDYLLPHHFSLDYCVSCGSAFPGERVPMIDKLLEKSEEEISWNGDENGGVGLASSSMIEKDNDDVDLIRGNGSFFSERTNYAASSSSFAAGMGNNELLADYVSGREDTNGLSSNRNSRFMYYDYKKGTRRTRLPTDCDFDPNVDSSENVTTDVANQLEEIRQRFNSLDGLAKVESSEHNRAELLRKLNELKDQLSRLNNTVETPMRIIGSDRGIVRPPLDLYEGQEPLMPESSTSLHNFRMQRPPRDKHHPRPLYHDQYHKPFHHGQSYDVHAPRHVPYEILQYRDAYRPQMSKTLPYQALNQYLPWTYPDHINGQDTDFNQDPLTSLPRETFFHQHGCSCYQCYSKNLKVSQKVPPPPPPPPPPNANHYQHENPTTNGSLYPNPMNLASPPLHSQDLQIHTRNMRDLDLENGVNVQCQRRRLVIDHKNKRIFHPVAGGAPIITCPICFELLKLSRKVMLGEDIQRKMRCGACSTIFLCEVDRKGIVISVQEQFNQSSERNDYSAERLGENNRVSSSSSDARVANSESKDYDSSGYNYQLQDKESYVLREDQNSNAAEMRQESSLSSSSFSDDEQLQDSATVHRADLISVEPPSEDNESLPIQEHHDNNSNSSISKDGKGNKGKRSYVRKLFHKLTNSRQNPVKDVTLASETDISSEAYMKSGVTQDSREESIDEEHPNTNNRSESIFSGLREYRSQDFSDSSQSLEIERSDVYVNGQDIPLLAVKKAEKLAGPIQPGEYWYDFQAGFWGVMGHPCLGIIAPYINAFNYPMPKGCAAGNTGVFVNGRELYQGDLDKLSGRGLPVTKHKSYIIKISGKVLDAETGEVLYSLGKLAPTVQRARRGFGMKVPKSLRKDAEGEAISIS